MTPPDPPYYFTLYAISENEYIREHYDLENINHSLSEESRKYLYRGGIIWAWDRKVENVTWDYTSNFNIESYPTFLIFDTEGVILKATDIGEVEDFLSANKPAWRESQSKKNSGLVSSFISQKLDVRLVEISKKNRFHYLNPVSGKQ